MYKVLRKIESDELLPVANAADLEQGKAIVKSLVEFWPGEYAIQDARSGEIVLTLTME